MSRINTNISSLIAQRTLGQNNRGLATSLERLSTGLRINRGKDDPAGLIASENLRAEKAAIGAAIGNAERAEQVVNIAEGGLVEISDLLVEIESLVDQSANESGLSPEELAANQIQVDSLLSSIDRIANSTSFQGIKLLNGNMDYVLSGVDTTKLDDVTVNAARVPEGNNVDVTVDVTASANKGQAFLNISSATGPDILSGAYTIEVAGNKGVQQFTFASNITSQAAVIAAINNFSGVTGVYASAAANSAIILQSTEYGTDSFVSVTKISGTTNNDNLIGTVLGTYNSNDATDYGVDASVNINGQAATVQGLTARISTSSLDVQVKIITNDLTSSDDVFSITGGGAKFSLSPTIDLSGQASLAIKKVTTGVLGSDTNGYISSLRTGGTINVVDGANKDDAQSSVRDAIKMVSQLRGRLGAFQKNTVGSTIRALGVAFENTSAAESVIRETDFAAETANLTRQQILTQAATSVLAMANAQPQTVLSLL